MKKSEKKAKEDPSSHLFDGLQKAAPYPCVVIRWMPTVYGRREVRFVSEPPRADTSDAILVHDPNAFARGKLTHTARHRLIEKVTALCRESGFRMCIVFAPNECVYCEPDGSSFSSREVPSGGIRVEGLTLPGRTTGRARLEQTKLPAAVQQPARRVERKKAPVTLIYGSGRRVPFVFIPREQALELAAVHDALGSASTWGEFRALMPRNSYEEFCERFVVDSKPRANEKFDGSEFSGGDCDYPDWPEQEMLDWVPREIIKAFGRVGCSWVSGEFLDLDLTQERKIVAAFRAAGFRCRKDEKLVLRASGCSEPKRKKRSKSELLRALASTNDAVRRSAIKEFESCGTSLLPTLMRALKDKNEKIRSGAATVLQKIQPVSPTTVAALIEALKDESEEVFQAVCYTLAEIGPEAGRAAHLLIEPWKRGSYLTRHAAGWALGKIGGDLALVVPALIEGLRDPHPDLRFRAIYSLGQIGPPAVPFLIEALKRNDLHKLSVATAFAKLGDAADQALVRAQSNDDLIVRTRAEKLLEWLRKDGFPKP